MLMYLSLIDSPEDKRKFELLYNEYKKTMYYAANRILKDSHSAEDAVHQAFLRIINCLEKIDETNYHRTKKFLVVITEHIAIDIYRKKKRENTLSFEEIAIYTVDNHSQSDFIDDSISMAISQLPMVYSTILRLKYSQGYCDNEIANLLNIKEDNVRKRISRAKKKLSQILNGGAL